MDKNYYETLRDLEKRGVARDYIHGWASGYLGNPKMEEQRVTAGYEAGYGDGAAGNVERAGEFVDES